MIALMTAVQDMNRAVFDALNNDLGHFWDMFFWTFSQKLVWVPLYLLILYLIYRKVGLRNMLVAMVVMVLMTVVCDHIGNFFKDNFSQLRPTHDPLVGCDVHTVNNYKGGLYGTVSSHTSISFSIAVFSLLVICKCWYTLPILVWAALVSLSRVYLGVHYPKDLVYGLILGVVAGYGFHQIYCYLDKNFKWLNPQKIDEK